MLKDKVIFIPIRKGSKRIPNKHIRKLGEKPMIFWILDTLIDINYDIPVWIATDCLIVENLINKRYGSLVNIFHRLEKNAQDASPSIDVVTEFLDIHQKQFTPDTYFILMQATSPFLCKDDIIKLLHYIDISNANNSYISCYREKKFRWSINGESLDYDLSNKPLRFDYDGYLVETGSFYASPIKYILEKNQLLSEPVSIIETGFNSSIDIDTEYDWIMAEAYVRYKNSI